MIRKSTGLESEFLNSGLDMLFIIHLILGKSYYSFNLGQIFGIQFL